MLLTTVSNSPEPSNESWEPSLEMLAALAGFERTVAQIDGATLIGRNCDNLVIDLSAPELSQAA